MSSLFLVRKSVFLPLFLMTMLAAGLRFWNLEQLPPGFWFDEAWSALAARDAGNQIYFEASFGGMHPAIIYLTRIWQMGSENPRIIRYVLATVSTLCVPLSFFAYRALFKLDNPQTARRTALLSSWILAFTYPFFHFSRLGFESLLPLPAALLTLFLLAQPIRGWRLLILGLLLGGSLYTFDTGRFIPIAFAISFWLVPGWFPAADAASTANQPGEPSHPSTARFGRRRMVTFSLITLIALLTAAPLLLYFSQNWDQLTQRATVTTYNTFGEGSRSVPLALVRNAGRTFAGLGISGFGDQLARHNLPGRAVLDPALGLLLLLTLFQAGRRRIQNQSWRPSVSILLIWLAVGLLPTILTDGAPTYTRIFVGLAALPPLVGLGAQSLWESGNRIRPYFGAVAVCAGLLFSASSTLWDYFVRWPQTPELYNEYSLPQWETVQFSINRAEENVYFVPETPYASEPVYDLVPPAAHDLPPPPCLILPPPDQDAIFLFDQRLASEAHSAYLPLFPNLSIATPLRHPLDGGAILRTLEIPAGSRGEISGEDYPAQFGKQIKLLKYAWDADQLTLVWEALSPNETNYSLFLHVYAAGQEDAAPLFQIDRQPCFPTRAWSEGERIIDTFAVTLPPELSAADVTLALGWYDPESLQRLTLPDLTPQMLDGARLILPRAQIP